MAIGMDRVPGERIKKIGPVAQLDRVPVSGTVGCAFDSRRGYDKVVGREAYKRKKPFVARDGESRGKTRDQELCLLTSPLHSTPAGVTF